MLLFCGALSCCKPAADVGGLLVPLHEDDVCMSSHTEAELYGDPGSEMSLEAVLESMQLNVATPLKRKTIHVLEKLI